MRSGSQLSIKFPEGNILQKAALYKDKIYLKILALEEDRLP